MRLLVVVVDAQHRNILHKTLAEKEFGATVLESSGGFLRHGSATVLMAVEDDRVEEAMEAVRSAVKPVERVGEAGRKATVGTNVFVVPIDNFEKA